MKIAVSVLLFFCVVLIGCTVETKTEVKEQFDRGGLVTSDDVATSIFDDGYSSVYIVPNNFDPSTPGSTVTDLVNKKRWWEQKNPGKRIISMCFSSGVPSYGSHQSGVAGLLIHYEARDGQSK